MKTKLAQFRKKLNALLDELEADLTVPVQPKVDNLPKSPEAIAVATLFARRLTTPWSAKEIKAFRDARKRGVLTAESMEIIVPYYKAERARDGIHRRDLLTFLNNFDGELDRAVAFNKPKKPMTRPTATPSPEDEARREQYLKKIDQMNGVKHD